MIEPCTRDRRILIAHRAGNSLARIEEAQEAGADLVECDVWLHRGRLEIRHEKTAGVLPILWDRWSLSPGWHARWTLPDLLQSVGADTKLFFDLKGRSREIPKLVLATIATVSPDRSYVVSSQHWDLLAPFHETSGAMRMYSVGNPFQLRALSSRLERDPDASVSINSRLLTREIVRSLKQQSKLVIPWRVTSLAQAQRLLEWGLDGLNVDNIDLLRQLVPTRM